MAMQNAIKQNSRAISTTPRCRLKMFVQVASQSGSGNVCVSGKLVRRRGHLVVSLSGRQRARCLLKRHRPPDQMSKQSQPRSFLVATASLPSHQTSNQQQCLWQMRQQMCQLQTQCQRCRRSQMLERLWDTQGHRVAGTTSQRVMKSREVDTWIYFSKFYMFVSGGQHSTDAILCGHRRGKTSEAPRSETVCCLPLALQDILMAGRLAKSQSTWR